MKANHISILQRRICTYAGKNRLGGVMKVNDSVKDDLVG